MKQARVLTPSEIKRLLRVASTTKHGARNRLIIMFSYLAGLRACEIAALRVGDVINVLNEGGWEVNSEIILRSNQTKGRKAQTVGLDCQCSTSERVDLRTDLSRGRLLGLGRVVHDHRSALAGECHGDPSADTGAATGNQRHTRFEFHRFRHP